MTFVLVAAESMDILNLVGNRLEILALEDVAEVDV